MKHAFLQAGGLFLLVMPLAAARAEHPFRVYWTDGHETFNPYNGTIDRAIPDGSAQDVVLLFPDDRPKGFAFDIPGRKMYWTTEISDRIMRANLDGTDVELVWDGSQLLSTVEDIVVDSAGGKMYWADQVMDSIRRANLDGSEVEDLVVIVPPHLESSAVIGIDLDLTAGKVYWTDWRLDKVQRANLDGSDVEDLIIDIFQPVSIALDVAAAKMYICKFDTSIVRANLDGSDIQNVVSGGRIRSGNLDLNDGKLYWLIYSPFQTPGIGMLRRANLDGSDLEDVIPAGIEIPNYVDILPGEVSLAEYAQYLDCATGPGVPYADPDCAPFDYDTDADIDLADFYLLQAAFTGPF